MSLAVCNLAGCDNCYGSVITVTYADNPCCEQLTFVVVSESVTGTKTGV